MHNLLWQYRSQLDLELDRMNTRVSRMEESNRELEVGGSSIKLEGGSRVAPSWEGGFSEASADKENKAELLKSSSIMVCYMSFGRFWDLIPVAVLVNRDM